MDICSLHRVHIQQIERPLIEHVCVPIGHSCGSMSHNYVDESVCRPRDSSGPVSETLAPVSKKSLFVDTGDDGTNGGEEPFQQLYDLVLSW